jgi:hypothetical protein
MMLRFSLVAFVAASVSSGAHAFTPPKCSSSRQSSSAPLFMAGSGDGSDAEWMKALLESSGTTPGEFEQQMKMKGLLGKKSDGGDPKLSANAELIKWLEAQGEVYMSEASSWGEAPHPMAISTETRDDITNESSGRGLLARRDVKDGDELLKIPLNLCFTKKSARKTLGKDVLPSEINEYLAIACQLIHEKHVLGEKSEFKAYIGVLPEVDEVNPTFAWKDEDLSFLDGSPVIAATRSMQAKLKNEYEALLGGENGLCSKYPDRFPKEVSQRRFYESSSLSTTSPRVSDFCSLHNNSTSHTSTLSGLLPCSFRERFVCVTCKMVKRLPWFRMQT